MARKQEKSFISLAKKRPIDNVKNTYLSFFLMNARKQKFNHVNKERMLDTHDIYIK